MMPASSQGMAKLPLRRRAQGFRSQRLVVIASVCLAMSAVGLSARIERGEQDQRAPLRAISAIRGWRPRLPSRVSACSFVAP